MVVENRRKPDFLVSWCDLIRSGITVLMFCSGVFPSSGGESRCWGMLNCTKNNLIIEEIQSSFKY
jgi:hypothetical protein